MSNYVNNIGAINNADKPDADTLQGLNIEMNDDPLGKDI